MPTVKFVKEKKEVEVPVGANLRRTAIDAGVNIYCGVNGMGATLDKIANCRGFGLCGTCLVKINAGMENTNAVTMLEKAKFKVPVPNPIPAFQAIQHEDAVRLACQTKVEGDIEVETGPEFNLFGDNFFS